MPKGVVLHRQDRAGLRRLRGAGDDPHRRGRPCSTSHPPPATWFQWFTFAWASVLGLVSGARCWASRSRWCPRTARAPARRLGRSCSCSSSPPGVFFVFSQLPQWMQVFASFFPLKWLTQAMRSVFLPRLRPDARGGRLVGGAGQVRRRAGCLVRGRAGAQPGLLPLDPSRLELTLPIRHAPAGAPGRSRRHHGAVPAWGSFSYVFGPLDGRRADRAVRRDPALGVQPRVVRGRGGAARPEPTTSTGSWCRSRRRPRTSRARCCGAGSRTAACVPTSPPPPTGRG